MRAGELRHRVTIQQFTAARDAVGGETKTWSDLATVYAAALPISGREYVALRQAQSDITIRFRLRYRSGINTGMRVVWDGRNYDIVEAINRNGRDQELELLCVGDAGNA